jgi:hypothetical protein
VSSSSSSSASGGQSSNWLAVRSSNWAVSPKFAQNVYYFFDGLEIELRWSHDRASAHPVTVHIQQSPMPTMQKAREYLAHILANARCLRKLNLNIQVSTTDVL